MTTATLNKPEKKDRPESAETKPFSTTSTAQETMNDVYRAHTLARLLYEHLAASSFVAPPVKMHGPR